MRRNTRDGNVPPTYLVWNCCISENENMRWEVGRVVQQGDCSIGVILWSIQVWLRASSVWSHWILVSLMYVDGIIRTSAAHRQMTNGTITWLEMYQVLRQVQTCTLVSMKIYLRSMKMCLQKRKMCLWRYEIGPRITKIGMARYQVIQKYENTPPKCIKMYLG